MSTPYASSSALGGVGSQKRVNFKRHRLLYQAEASTFSSGALLMGRGVLYQEKGLFGKPLDERQLRIASGRVTPSPTLGGLLTVPLDILAMSASHLLVRDKIWLSEKKSQMHGPGSILHHHRRLDGSVRGGA